MLLLSYTTISENFSDIVANDNKNVTKSSFNVRVGRGGGPRPVNNPGGVPQFTTIGMGLVRLDYWK
jgi:hypothetical protein